MSDTCKDSFVAKSSSVSPDHDSVMGGAELFPPGRGGARMKIRGAGWGGASIPVLYLSQ